MQTTQQDLITCTHGCNQPNQAASRSGASHQHLEQHKSCHAAVVQAEVRNCQSTAPLEQPHMCAKKKDRTTQQDKVQPPATHGWATAHMSRLNHSFNWLPSGVSCLGAAAACVAHPAPQTAQLNSHVPLLLLTLWQSLSPWKRDVPTRVAHLHQDKLEHAQIFLMVCLATTAPFSQQSHVNRVLRGGASCGVLCLSGEAVGRAE